MTEFKLLNNHPPASKANREVANLTDIKNPHTPESGITTTITTRLINIHIHQALSIYSLPNPIGCLTMIQLICILLHSIHSVSNGYYPSSSVHIFTYSVF